MQNRRSRFTPHELPIVPAHRNVRFQSRYKKQTASSGTARRISRRDENIETSPKSSPIEERTLRNAFYLDCIDCLPCSFSISGRQCKIDEVDLLHMNF
jgi:hypothetical protein